MTQEEKAKAYDEATEKAKEIIRYYKTRNRGDEASIEDLETIFPELKESEVENMRKEIISIIKSYRKNCITKGNHRFDDCIAWLEKQGEKQKLDGTYINVDDVRENFMGTIYRVLSDDPTNDRANAIINAFDSLPTVKV